MFIILLVSPPHMFTHINIPIQFCKIIYSQMFLLMLHTHTNFDKIFTGMFNKLCVLVTLSLLQTSSFFLNQKASQVRCTSNSCLHVTTSIMKRKKMDITIQPQTPNCSFHDFFVYAIFDYTIGPSKTVSKQFCIDAQVAVSL